MTLLTGMLLVACTSPNNTGISVGSVINVNGLPPSKEYDIIGYHDNKLIIASHNSEDATFDMIMHHDEIYIYDTISKKGADTITLNGDSLVRDFVPTETGYIYTYSKMVKGISYEPTDLNKITRLIKLDSAVYAITEVSEKEPAISIYKYLDGKQDVFYSSNNPVVSTNLYPSEKGFIFVEYVEGKSKLMEVDGKNVKRMFSIKGEVFDVTSIDGHTYFHLLDNDLLRVVDENGRESSFVFEEDQTVYFGDSIYSKVSHQDPLTLQYNKRRYQEYRD